MKRIFYVLIMAIVGYSCTSTECCLPEPTSFGTTTTIINSQDEYDEILARIQSNELVSDPFELDSLYVENGLANIIVQFSGGCREHDFALVWSESMSLHNPPQVYAILLHEDNDDMCEAYPTEILEFDLNDNPFNYDAETMSGLHIIIINGSDTTEQVANQ